MPDMFGCTTGNMFELMFEDGIIMDLTGQEFLSSVEPSSLKCPPTTARTGVCPTP